jgi:hypothetical protein
VSHSRKLLSIVRSGPEAPDGMVVMCKRTENASLRDPRPGGIWLWLGPVPTTIEYWSEIAIV